MDNATPPMTLDPITADQQIRPWQFNLWHLLALVTSVCVLGATYQWFGVEVAVFLAGICVVVLMVVAVAGKRIVEVLVVLAIFGVLFVLLMPRTGGHGPASRRLACSNNLKQIAIALHNYHDVYGSFPPAYVPDKNGRPMHSWRVLILPFMDHKALYDLYRFDEPWDGPNNAKLGAQYVSIYGCPSDAHADGNTDTSYVAVVGSGTAWPGEKAAKLSAIKDGSENTLLVVEVHNSGIHWMEPRDLHIGQMPLAINSPRGQGMSSKHPECAQAVFADGHVDWLKDSTPPETFRALLTINGGETVVVP